MKPTNIKLFFLAAMLIFMNSCSKDEAVLDEESITIEQTDLAKQSAAHEGLFEYARLVSIAINKHSGMNEALQEKALELQSTGYYEQEFYVGMQGETQAKGFGNNSLNSLLEDVDGEKSAVKIKDYLKTNPAMSVLLIGDAKSQKFSNRVYVDNGFDDMNPMEMIYYYENGTLHSESISEELTSNAFIVRNSEVYINEDDAINKTGDDAGVVLFSYADGRSVKVNSGAVNANSKLVPIDEEPGGGGGGSGYPPPPTCNEPCERDCESGTENLWRFRTQNDYDGFWRGKGEWFFVIIWADGANYTLQNGGVTVTGSALSYLRTGQINNVRGDYSWHYPNFSSIIWDRVASPTNPVADGNRMKVACFESDGGSTQTFTATLTYSLATQGAGTFGFNLPISFTINDGDDFIGEYLVEYCHDIGSNGFIYNPEYQVDFQHNER
ncbi:hypothetical protein H2O64_00160 [Kordia sp. YSTF-M3]|uniref:DUF4848 domain-containing protein n=1 Tax=Kordia aestuariivivens TaxID=2759037 RepID=A0ABR7Q3E6_9FLAO|nr:hypothetical protein [Kordia aestuariivivens]MBC8753062.1 hypothetical protein [Kordia aestuariivivens]